MPSVTGAYRGAERRTPPPPPLSLQSAFAVGGLVLLVAVVGAGLLHSHHVALPADRSQRLLDLARTTTLMAAAAAFTVCLIRWQQSAESAVSLIGTAVLAFGLGVVGTSGLLLPAVADADSPLVSATRAASLLVVFAALVAALVWPPVDTRLSPLRLAAGALAVAAVLSAALDRLPRLADLLAFGHRSLEGVPVPSSGGRAVLGGVWALLALVLSARGLRRGRALLAWAGLMLFALALAELSAIAAKSAHDLWLLASIVVQTLAMVFVLVGLADELQRTYLDQRARLFDSQVAMQTVEARGRLVGEGSGRRRHDVGNALMAIQGAARTLEREYDHLSEDGRRRMAEMLGTSVQGLHRLVGEDPTAPGAFPLVEPVDAALSPLRSAGVALAVSVPEGLRVVGVRTATTEALRRVGDAVWTARPRQEVEVVGVELGGAVWLSVVFEPSSPRAMRLLGRLRRNPRADSLGYWGDGATLTVAARLVEDMGGGLTAEPDGDTRLAFRLTLPAAPPDAAV